MPQPLSIANVIEANRVSSDVAFLIFIDVEIVDPATGVVVTELNFVRNTEDIILNGKPYQKSSFDISISQESGKQSEVTLTVTDYTQALQSFMEEYGGGVGSNVTMSIQSAAELDAAPDLVEYFQITGASASDYIQNFTLGAENALMLTFPRRRQTRDFCQWRYKGEGCGYVGALESCDLTLQGTNGCDVHGNSLNFGGFPGMNSNGYRYA